MKQKLLLLLVAAAALFHLYGAGFSPFTAFVQRPVHFALMAVLGVLGLGVHQRVKEIASANAEETVKENSSENSARRWLFVATRGLLIAAVVFCCFYR